MKGMANAKAYVAYAQAHPGMYGLMFRTERLDMSRPSLHEAATASFAGLASAVGASRNEKSGRGRRRCRSIRPRRSRAPGRWCTASPCCCSMDGCPTFCGGCPRAPTSTNCFDAMLLSTVARPAGMSERTMETLAGLRR